MTMPDDDQPDDQPRDRPRDQLRDRDVRTGRGAAAARIQHQHQWVDQQIRLAMDRGDFDNLPGAGKPIEGLGSQHDPDWWIKKLVEREHIAVLPPSLQLRKDDARLDERLDAISFEAEVRRELEEFNERVIRARYSLSAGPPLITMPRDVEPTVERWRERRDARRAEQAERVRELRAAEDQARAERPWWRRRRSG